MEVTGTITLKQDWLVIVKSSAFDVALDITTDSKDNVYIAGYTEGELVPGAHKGFKDIFLAIYAGNKKELWRDQLGTPELDEASGIAVDKDGNVYIAGFTSGELEPGAQKGFCDFFLARFAGNGDKYEKKWLKQMGTYETDIATSIAVDNRGNVYIAGSTYGELERGAKKGGADAFLAKCAGNGDVQWFRQLGTPRSDIAYGIAADSGGNVYIAGSTCGDLEPGGHRGAEDIFLAKYNSSGTQQWIKQLGSPEIDTANGIAVDSEGNVYITGKTLGQLEPGAHRGAADIFLAKYDSSGTQQWVRQLGSPGNDTANDIAVDSKGNVYITGFTKGELEPGARKGPIDIFLAKYVGNGDRHWVKQLSFSACDEEARGIAADSQGNVYIAGITNTSIEPDSNKLYGDIFLAKFHEEKGNGDS